MLRSVIHMSGWKNRLWNSLENRRRCSSRDPFYSRGLTCSVYWFWFIACVILWRNIAWISFTWRAASGYSIDTMLTWKEQLIDYMRSRIVSLLTHTLPFLAPSNQNIQRSERRKSTGITFFFLLATWIVHLPLRDAYGKVRLLRVSKSPNWPKTLKSSFFHFGKKKTNHDGDFCFVSEMPSMCNVRCFIGVYSVSC